MPQGLPFSVHPLGSPNQRSQRAENSFWFDFIPGPDLSCFRPMSFVVSAVKRHRYPDFHLRRFFNNDPLLQLPFQHPNPQLHGQPNQHDYADPHFYADLSNDRLGDWKLFKQRLNHHYPNDSNDHDPRPFKCWAISRLVLARGCLPQRPDQDGLDS